jgi:uncharacterized protein YdbL (DUF1318 family)
MSAPNRSSDPTRRWILAALALVFLAFAAPAAEAQSSRPLDAPRAAGQVGERYDGYAVVRGSVPADVAQLVDRVNAERKTVYEQRAAADKAPVDAVGKIYAKEIMQSAPSGTWFLGENGQWTQQK